MTRKGSDLGGRAGEHGNTVSAARAADDLSRASEVAARKGLAEAAEAVEAVDLAAEVRRYRRYPAYRDSAVEWLGEVPEHWEVARLKYLATMNPESLREDTDPTLEIRYIDIGSVDGLGRIGECESLTFGAAPSRARRIVRHGDVIVSTVRTYLRAIAPIHDPESGTIVSTGFAVVRPNRMLVTRYASHAFRAPYFVERVVAHSKGVSYPAINEPELATFALLVPPTSEQRAIAAFLDRETTRIDGLLAKKEQLIELLQEKRTALITRAVTKGLDPTVPMKDSGVEWLGEIPAHWGVKALRHAIHFQRGHDLPSNERDNGDVPIVTSSGISSTHAVAIAKAPGIVTGRYGTIGEFHLVLDDYWPLNTTLYSKHLRENDPRFLLYMLQHLSPIFVASSQKSAVPGVDRNDLHPTPVALPDVSEQKGIAPFLDRETSKLDALVAKVREAIERLKELRTALVSAAVTGKIDVRKEIQ